jgi:hypothetical protein
MYGYRPFFVNLTVNLAVFPGLISSVFLPSILKSWDRWPTFLNTNVTVPGRGSVFSDSLK